MQEINNPDCELFETETCAALNMRSCKACPVLGGEAESIEDDVALFTSLLPEGGLAPLFESESCQLCKGEKGKASGFAILDMGHSEPVHLQKRSFLGFTTSSARNGTRSPATGFMVPLQFASCRACRRRLLFLDYLPLLCATLLTAVAVAVAVGDTAAMQLRAIHPMLPLFLVGGGLLLGYLAGLLTKALLARRYNKRMYVDALTHPVAVAMKEKGWFPIMGQGRGKLIFAKKRISKGLGSAPGDAFEKI